MKKSKENKYLSASRIKTFESCSWLYWCKYHLNLPEKTNEGALKGSVTHLILELLLFKKHKKHLNSIVKSLDVDSSQAVGRLIRKKLKEFNIDTEEIYEEVCNFILVGLQYDFLGKGGKNLVLKVPIGTQIFEEDNKTVIYSVIDHNQRPYAIRKHVLCKDYDVEIAESQVRDLDAIVEKLNSTFQEDLKDEVEAFNFFIN